MQSTIEAQSAGIELVPQHDAPHPRAEQNRLYAPHR